MKKLFAALALCVSTVAFAQEDTAATEKQEKQPEAPSAQQGSRELELFEATDLRSQKPGSSTANAAEEKRRKDEKGIGGSGDDKTVAEKTKDVLGIDEEDKKAKKVKKDDDRAIGGSGRELEKDARHKARKTQAKTREAGEDTRGMARDAARDTKDATNEAAGDLEDAAKDTKNNMDQEMNQ